MDRRREVARVLKKFLDERKLKPSKFARQIGASPSSVIDLLKMENGLGRELAEKLIAGGVDERDLLDAAGFTIEHDEYDRVVQRVARKMSKMSPADKKLIEDIADSLIERGKVGQNPPPP